MSNNEVDPTPEERPKPGSWRRAVPVTETTTDPVVVGETVSTKTKPKYVPKPHLTERPFQENEKMQELRRKLHEQNKPRRQSRTPKESK